MLIEPEASFQHQDVLRERILHPVEAAGLALSAVQASWPLVLSTLLSRRPSRETGQGEGHFYFQRVSSLLGSKWSFPDH